MAGRFQRYSAGSVRSAVTIDERLTSAACLLWSGAWASSPLGHAHGDGRLQIFFSIIPLKVPTCKYRLAEAWPVHYILTVPPTVSFVSFERMNIFELSTKLSRAASTGIITLHLTSTWLRIKTTSSTNHVYAHSFAMGGKVLECLKEVFSLTTSPVLSTDDTHICAQGP